MDFLEDYEHVIGWTLDGKKGPGGVNPELVFIGPGQHALEIALARASTRPRADEVRKLWKARHGGRPSPVMLVVAHPGRDEDKATICGPVGDNPPVIPDLGLAQVERLCSAALAEPNRHSAVRFLVAMLDGLHTTDLLPGVRNMGMLATHELRAGVPSRTDWATACGRSRKLLSLKGRDLIEALGFGVETLSTTSSVLTIKRAKRVIAIFLDEGEGFEDPATRFNGISPVSNALALADRENLPWVVLTRGRQIRLYSARPDIGVGRKGRAETFVELNLALLPEEAAGYLNLLFGPEALAEGGTFEEILKASADHAAELGKRLRERVYYDAVPGLSKAVAARMGDPWDLSEEDLEFAYEQTLVILFRLLFVAYAEDKDLLPYRTNSRYAHDALKTLARDLSDRVNSSEKLEFDPNATDLWDQIGSLWGAVAEGNRDWGVPVYNGGLFSDDPRVNRAGEALAGIKLTNSEIGPALFALLISRSDDETHGPVDFRSLSVREFGTIYEGLLESRLSVAPSDLTLDARGNYVPATRKAQSIEVSEGEVYFHNRSGSRKSTGSYFTKPFAVEHLLDHALEPALADHIERLTKLHESRDEASVAEAFFDFRCADLAMGSGHFLVAAVDRIEARLSAFLALHPVSPINAELERLRTAALKALGDLADGVEIEHTSLLRRQVARRCIYGIDLNRIAVELARLAVWIHTFVPGLPLSFLDHNLVEGNILTGIATLDEALDVLDPVTDRSKGGSLIGDRVQAFLEQAEGALRRAARISEATKAEVDATRDAWEQAATAIEPARQLFTLVVAARIGELDPPVEISEQAISGHAGLRTAENIAEELQALHLPVAFPEVFLRDNPGFDCILGNPPWEKVRVEELSFWAIRFPGLKALPQGQQRIRIRQLRKERPDLVGQYEAELKATEEFRRVLLSGPYPGMGSGDPDLYKAFCWRFLDLTRTGGSIGVVLPRSALFAAGSADWREAVLQEGGFAHVTFLTNTGGWVFDDAEPRYTIGLVSIRKEEGYPISISGPFANLDRYLRSMRTIGRLLVPIEEFRTWSSSAAFPMLPSEQSATVFMKFRRMPSFSSLPDHGWLVRPVREFDSSLDRKNFELDKVGPELWPVYKGASFNLWNPDTGSYYARIDASSAIELLQAKRLRAARRSKGIFSEFASKVLADPDSLPCLRPRIAFRRIARATDSRTSIACLVPPRVVLTDVAPYLLWANGDPKDEAYLLGILSSIPLDWYARRVVETHVDFHVLDGFPIPVLERKDQLRRKIESLAGRLAALDARFRDWAHAVGVESGPLEDAEQAALVSELNACAALAYGLGESDVRHVFETFHEGWAYQQELENTLALMETVGAEVA